MRRKAEMSMERITWRMGWFRGYF